MGSGRLGWLLLRRRDQNLSRVLVETRVAKVCRQGCGTLGPGIGDFGAVNPNCSRKGHSEGPVLRELQVLNVATWKLFSPFLSSSSYLCVLSHIPL